MSQRRQLLQQISLRALPTILAAAVFICAYLIGLNSLPAEMLKDLPPQPVAIASVVLLAAILLFVQLSSRVLDVLDGKVLKTNGILKRTEIHWRIGRSSGTRITYKINEVDLNLPQSRQFAAFLREGEQYVVYYLPRSKLIVSYQTAV